MITLREHQDEAVEAAQSRLEGGDSRVIVEMATGTGKSFTQAELLERYGEKGTTAVFVPSEHLVVQNAAAYKTYALERGKEVPFIVGVFSGEAALDADVQTTDPQVIAASRAQAEAQGRRVIVLSTYASAGRVEEAGGAPYALVVADEAHRMASGEALEKNSSWSKPLFDAHIPAEKRAHFTATLRPDGDMDSQSRALAMNNAEVFGPLVYSFGYAAARDRGVLAPITPHIVPIEASEIERAMTEAGAGPRDGESEGAFKARRRAFAATLMVPATVERARADNGQASVLVLCPPGGGGAHADTVARVGGAMLDDSVRVASVHGKSATDVGEVLEWGRTKGQESLVAVVDMLREGTDMPALNSLIIARPAESHILLTQALGRTTRLHPEHWNLPPKKSNVLVPVIVDSRQGGAVVDGELAANFVSGFVRLDAGALSLFQTAQMEDAREGAQTNPTRPEGQKKTAASIGALFGVNPEDPATAGILDHIARQVAGSDSIGHTHHMMGRYLAYVEKAGINAYDRTSIAPSRAKKTPPEHNQIALWARSATEAYAHGRLSQEEATLLETTPGFVFAHNWDPKLYQGCVRQAVARHGMLATKTSDKGGQFPGLESLDVGAQFLRESVFEDAPRDHVRGASQARAVPRKEEPVWRAQAQAWWRESLAQGTIPSWAPPAPGVVRKMEGVLGRDADSQQWVLYQEPGKPVLFHPQGDEAMSEGARYMVEKVESLQFRPTRVARNAMPYATLNVSSESLALPLRVDPALDDKMAAHEGRRVTMAVAMEPTDHGQGLALRITPEAADRIGQDTKEARRASRQQKPSYVSDEAFWVGRAARMLHKEGWPTIGKELLEQGFDAKQKVFKDSPLTLGQVIKKMEGVRDSLISGELSNGDVYHLNNTPGFDWVTPYHAGSRASRANGKVAPGEMEPQEKCVSILQKLSYKSTNLLSPLGGIAPWGSQEAFGQDDAYGRANRMAFRIMAKEMAYGKKLARDESLTPEEKQDYKRYRGMVKAKDLNSWQPRDAFVALYVASEKDPTLHKARGMQVNAEIGEQRRKREAIKGREEMG